MEVSYNDNIELVNENAAANTNSIFTNTGVRASVIKQNIETLKTRFKTGFTVSVTEGVIDNSLQLQNDWPVVCIISGAGGNGKDSFIEYMSKYASIANYSSVEKVKEIADELSKFNVNYTHLSDVDEIGEISAKTDRYREFLWEIKQAWTKFSNGPTVNLLGMIQDRITNHDMQGSHTDIIFLHIREADQIAEMKTQLIDRFGLIPITVKLQGLVETTDYTNNCDARVDEYTDFDIVINNIPGDTFMLEIKAMLFARILKTTTLYLDNALPTTDNATSNNSNKEPQHGETTTFRNY